MGNTSSSPSPSPSRSRSRSLPTQPIRHPVSPVPAHLRSAHPVAFDTKKIFLGPIHDDDDWNDSLAFKSNSVFDSLSRADSGFKPDELWRCITKHLSETKSISNILSRITEAQDARELDMVEFSQLLQKRVVGDAVFLVSCFLADLHTNPEGLRSKYKVAAINDIAKLDNQLPLELVQAVVAELPSALKATESEKSKNSNTDEVSASKPETFQVRFSEDDFPRVILSFCRFYSFFQQTASPSLDLGKKKTLLDFLHTTISGEFESKEAETSTARPEIANSDCPTARELVRVGIRFEPEGAQNIAGILFENGVLRLPALVLNDLTETVIRNLMVLEASYKERPLSDYVRFLNMMVKSGEDVAVLRKAGILQGYFEDDEVAEFMKSLDDFHVIPVHHVLPIQKALEHLQTHYDEKVKIKEGPVHLAEKIEKKKEHVDRLVENIEKKEGHADRLVDNIANKERHVDHLAENIEKKEEKVNRLAENIEKKERHVNLLAENIVKKEGQVSRWAENIEKKERHTSRLVENIETKVDRMKRWAVTILAFVSIGLLLRLGFKAWK